MCTINASICNCVFYVMLSGKMLLQIKKGTATTSANHHIISIFGHINPIKKQKLQARKQYIKIYLYILCFVCKPCKNILHLAIYNKLLTKDY